MLGLLLGMTERVPIRHDDKGGNVAGTKLAKFVAEIHDRSHEGTFWAMRFKHFFDGNLRTVTLRVLNIRDLMPA